jgi:linoleoyl-CoA desaturase
MYRAQKIAFPKADQNDFYHQLKGRIKPLMLLNERKASILTVIQTILFPSVYIVAYCLLLKFGKSLPWFYFFYALMGIMLPLTVLNIVHDALHHSLFKNARLNHFAVYFLDLMGGNSYVWGKRHVHFHHGYTNIPGWDVDLEKKKIFRLSPTDKLRPGHRFQHFYMPFVYLLFTFHWVVFRDFKDYFQKSSMFRDEQKFPEIEYAKLIFFKIFYYGYIIVVPLMYLHVPWHHFLYAFLLLHAFASMITLMIILPTHWDEHAEFRLPNKKGQMKENWALHQLITTNDYATKQPVINFILGGLNHHIAHHLFPSVNHNYLPAITKEVVRITKEQSLPYKCFSFGGALSSHFRLLRNNGFDKNILNEDML